jgi:hypothetical protein
VNVDGTLRQGPLTAGQAEAKDVADLMAARELAAHSLLPPDQADRLVADLAAHPEIWDREILTVALGHRLTEADRGDLATSPDPVRLAETMAATDVLAPETILRVLRAEGVDGPAAVGLVPALGVPVADAIQMLHDEWGLDRLQVAAALDATVDELRAAGCTPVELLAAAPREVLRGLDARESTWMTVGPSLLEAGYSEAQAVAHLGCQCTNIRNVRCRRRCHDR